MAERDRFRSDDRWNRDEDWRREGSAYRSNDEIDAPSVTETSMGGAASLADRVGINGTAIMAAASMVVATMAETSGAAISSLIIVAAGILAVAMVINPMGVTSGATLLAPIGTARNLKDRGGAISAGLMAVSATAAAAASADKAKASLAGMGPMDQASMAGITEHVRHPRAIGSADEVTSSLAVTARMIVDLSNVRLMLSHLGSGANRNTTAGVAPRDIAAPTTGSEKMCPTVSVMTG